MTLMGQSVLAGDGLRRSRRARYERNDFVDGVGECEQVAKFLLMGELEEKRIDGLASVFGGVGRD
jgi:hypothetical protein